MKSRLSEIRSEADLEAALSLPSERDVEFASRLQGDVLILGAGGKMGPTLARRITAAFAASGRSNRAIAVSRFSDADQARRLGAAGVDVRRVDLWSEEQRAALPDCPNVLYLVGTKFGTTGDEAATWATNTFLPGLVASRFADSRISALSTGNVYPMVETESGGCSEEDPPSPVGEYAQSCLGRERILEHFSRLNGTPMTLVRLNYAVEGRYGVLLDIGLQVFRRQPVPLAMGHLNLIWQGDANSFVFRSLDLAKSPPRVLNLTGPETISVREAALAFGKRFGVPVEFEGREGSTAFLSNASPCIRQLGPPEVGLDELIQMTADWIARGGKTLGKPTHFQVRDGHF